MEWKPLSIPIEGKNDIWLHTHDDDDGDDDEMLVVKWKQIYTIVHALVTSNLSVYTLLRAFLEHLDFNCSSYKKSSVLSKIEPLKILVLHNFSRINDPLLI